MAPPAPAYSSFVAVSRPAASGTVIVIAWILALCSMLYLLPWAVAATRNKSGEIAIFLINFFLGWTVIGWFVALIMACCPEPQTPVVVINHVPPPQPYYR
ncbi:superinfection immunity protein [Flexivirga caeni]|uniref:Superinfection immunity protein n=2 Tax=Flexivirga caeni TaxID=2294115 RepID=A0A3M9MIY9_9MICO|nr:superinfection immunity protein [Flexivirga caeni]